ncbi:hypothetical protein ACQ4M3_25295 [Leptolyngbya sp. AN03gr2]|uniref:hypothetical protein n=1 Tax=unclassified Leptolyngbya TaxID=2650499 RepID=UPI003D31B14E
MNESEWSEIKRILVQAYIVLEELMSPLAWNNADSTTQENVEEAKNRIAEALQDPEVEEAAQLIEYETLLQKLEALEMPITDEEIDISERFRNSY